MPPEPSPVSEIIATEINDTETIVDDVDEVAEQLAAHDVISQERHDEILERVDTCQNQLQQLSTQVQSLNQSETAENPILSQILQSVTEIRTEMETVKASLKSLQDSTPTTLPTPSESIQEQTPEVVEPSPAESIVEPEQAVQPPPKARRKFRLL